MGAAGTYTAAIGASGYSRPAVTALVESWDGSNWTEIADVNTARYLNEFSVGTQTAALVFQGYSPALSAIAQNVEQWNGSSWTEVAEFNTSRRVGGGFGTSTAALAIAGLTPAPSNVANVESWNGSAWTETSDVNTARHGLGSTSTPYTTGIVFGGNDNLSVTESWDGSSWTEVADMATARTTTGAGTSAQSALAIGGYTGSFTAATEEWTFSGIQPTDPAAAYADAITGDFYYNSTTGQFKTVNTGGAPIGTWSSGGTMNTDERYISAAAGTNTAGIAYGGQSPDTADTELYDGTSWTEVNNLNQARAYLGGAGTQTAALAICGSPTPTNSLVESWDGTNWTEIAEVNSGGGAYGSGSCGTQTAALITMRISGPEAYTELWNGSAWTEVNDMNTAREGGGIGGISTSCIAAGGSPDSTNAETWNGTSWTEVSEINTSRQTLGGSGSSITDSLIFGGNRPGASPSLPGNQAADRTEFWDGSSWTEVGDLATKRYGAGAGKTGSSSSSTFSSGGSTGTAPTGVTEEWTAADFLIKTVTTS
jgi:hypothetical protein